MPRPVWPSWWQPSRCWSPTSRLTRFHGRWGTTYETPADEDVISTYQEIIRWIDDGDPTTRRLLESILADEEEHADDLLDLLG